MLRLSPVWPVSAQQAGDRARLALWALLALPALRAVLMVCLLGLSGLVHADGPRDHDRARAAVQAGEVMPLPALLRELERSHPGQVLELELDHEHGRWIYEVKLLQSDGQLLKLEMDARTGAVLKLRRKGDRRFEPERSRRD